MSTFNPSTLTREKVIATILADPIFVAGLNQLKKAQGVSHDSIRYIDDHNNYINVCDVDNVVVVARFERDGTPSSPRPLAESQNGATHLPAWIMPGCRREVGGSFDWGRNRCKNPLFVGNDGRVHLSIMATGMNLRFYDKDSEFDAIVRKQRGVYTQSCAWAKCECEMHEAHIWMMVDELSSLI